MTSRRQPMPVTKKVVALSSLVALSAAAIAPALAQQSLNGAGATSVSYTHLTLPTKRIV